ncbi:CBS domain-containing protein [Haliea sp. AH-315-K21]|nr:CBS domain-containing protein [Haliea sp. AH-315-K21]
MAIILNEDVKLSDALDEMIHQKSRLIFVIDYDSKLSGVVSQGDLLKNYRSSGSIKLFMEMNPVYLLEKDRSRALELLKKFHFLELPILSDDFKIIDVVSIWDLV